MTKEKDVSIAERKKFPVQELESAVNQAAALMTLTTLAATFEDYKVLASPEEMIGAMELKKKHDQKA